jgi:hypothetical protein
VKIPTALLFVVLASASAAQQQQQNSQVLWWSGTWDAAFAEAKLRNVPVLVVFVQDGEEANERLVTGTLTDPDYVKATHNTVPIIANREFHGVKKDEVAGVVKAVCVKFGATSCEAHQNLESPARVELCGSEVQTPQHVLVLPDKTIVDRIVDVAPVSAYQILIGKGTKKLGKGLTALELKQVREHLREAAARIEKEDWGAALKLVRDAVAIAKDTPFAKQADAFVTKIDEEARKELEGAKAMEKAGDVVGAMRLLESAVDVFAGTGPAAALKKELARMKGTKAGTEAARILAKEKRAGTSFEAGQAAEKAKDFLTARREYQRVVAAAAGTPLAEKAALRLQIFEADRDIKALFDRADRDAKAAAALKEAEKLAAAGNKDAAREALKKIVADFEGTTAAATARTRLEELR